MRALAIAVFLLAAALLLAQPESSSGPFTLPDVGAPGALGGPGAPEVVVPPGPAGGAVPAGPLPPAVSLAAGRRLTLAYNGPRAEGLGSQCTAYAVDRMYEATGLWLRSRGHAGQWGETAREAGWTVGSEAAPRSIAVMPYAGGYRYALFTGGKLSRAAVHPEYGHVGWVERLDASGSWALLSDQNWNGDGARGSRWVWLKSAPLQFIYSDR
jgi:surface antigen